MIRQILNQVKANKKYKSIANSVVEKEINYYLKSNLIKNIEQITKQDIKNIRSKLHKSYSSFQTKKKKKRDEYLEALNLEKLLSITLSTKERINDYPTLYKKIFKITRKPNIIIDLGCGLNPLSFPLMNLKKEKLDYYAYDIDEEDKEFLNKYFKIIKNKNPNFNGKAAILDLRNLREVSQIPPSDIIFLFKVLDILDQTNNNHKLSEELIKTIIKKTKFIVASFATQTITRKKMNFPTRKWFELMLKRNNLKFETIKTDNEIYYVVSE